MKKTFEVEELKQRINLMLLNSTDDYKDGREALINIIEHVLMKSGNYGGFVYLDVDDMKSSDQGMSIGVNDTSKLNLSMEEHFANTDHTRVKYF